MITAALVDYGAGNLVSIGQALELVGAHVVHARRPADMEGADLLVVPGVGASGPAMTRLRRAGLADAIREAVESGTWYLGICLGLQLLFDHSDEDGARMLGLLRGRVALIPDAPRLPHIGWNTIEPLRDHPLLRGIAFGTPAYFVHSYAAMPDDASTVVAQTEHGGRFASAVAHERLLGVQFHPERSGADGLHILAAAVGLVEGRPPAEVPRGPVAFAGVA
jgi:imidazole glycerol-phosphate synthase subunit HisH